MAKRLLLGCAVLIAMLAPAAAAQAPAVHCGPSPEVDRALKDLPDTAGLSAAEARAKKIEALRSLLERFPDNVFIHSRYQDTARYPAARDRDAVIAEYRALAEKKPNDPLCAYLALRARIGVESKQVIPELEKLAELPQARLSLVEIYQSRNFRDPKKAREQLEAYAKACPNALEGFSYFRSLEPSDFLKQSAERLRAILAERNTPYSLASYSTLWALEFRVTPGNEHEALRKRVAEDLKRLRQIDAGNNQPFYSMLSDGYKITGDEEGQKWVTEQMKANFPKGSSSAFNAVYQEWRAKNPYPKSGDPPEKRKAVEAAEEKASGEWIHQFPDEASVWYMRIGVLQKVDKPDPAQVEEAGEGFLRAHSKNPSGLTFMSSNGGSSSNLVVADLYSKKNVRPDRLPDLIDKGMEEIEKPRPSSSGWQSDLYVRPAAGEDESQSFARWYGWLTVADLSLKLKDKDRTGRALQRLQALLDQSKPKGDPKSPEYASKQRAYAGRQGEYWDKAGALAELEGRKIDALTFYQNALLARPSLDIAKAKIGTAEKARALWKELGGGEEAWQAWSNRARELFGQALSPPAGGPNWTSLDKPLPAFELADMKGTKWRLADFKGKTTLINVWATW